MHSTRSRTPNCDNSIIRKDGGCNGRRAHPADEAVPPADDGCRLTQLTRQFLPQMTAAEKSRALRSLKALIDAELFDLAASEGAEDDPDRACPWCGSPHYVKRGRDGRGPLKALIDAELFELAASEGAEDDPDRACPWCGSPHYVKRGRDGRGRQRVLCRGCARTFTDATMRIFSTTKLDRSAWMRFAECHVDMLPLRESAD